MARLAKIPPFLSSRVGCHAGGVGGDVRADVFKVTEEIVIPVGELAEEDRVVADVAVLYLLKDLRPDRLVNSLV
jgi:hypothetical protein